MNIRRKNDKLTDESRAASDSSVEPTAAPTTPIAPNSTKRSGCLTKTLIVLVLGLALVAGLVWYAIVEARRVPEFYAQVLDTDMDKAEADGQLFERNLIQLQNTARRRHPWLIDITEAQVNGWFASDLVEKFPDSLPADISDPRVVFTQDEIRLAFKYSVSRASGIVVISADVFCTDNPNEIAIQINDVRTGLVRLPIGPWLETVGDSIRRAGIPVFWAKSSDVPLAIFTLPEHITTKATHHVVVEAIDLRPGRLVIAGKTIKQSVEKESRHQPAKK